MWHTYISKSSGAGDLQCVSTNQTNAPLLQQVGFIEQECTELWPLYAKYFPYFLSLQCFLLLALRSAWQRSCQHQLRTFAELVSRCKNGAVTKRRAEKFLDYYRRSRSGAPGVHNDDAENDADDNSHVGSVESYVSVRGLQWDEAHLSTALEIHDSLRQLPDELSSLKSVSLIYQGKSLIGVALSFLIVGWGASQVM